MKTHYLFPNRFKVPGMILFGMGLVLGIFELIFSPDLSFLKIKTFAIVSDHELSNLEYFKWISNYILDEIAGVFLIVGGIIFSFSKEKVEDEFISKLRLDSLVWATHINYLVILIAIIFVYDFTFLWVMVFNLFTILIFFSIRFHWVLYTSKIHA